MTAGSPTAHALVLAGGAQPAHPVARMDGVAAKAFARVDGRAMVEHVVQALIASERVARVTLSLHQDALDAADLPEIQSHLRDGRVTCRAPGPSRAASVRDGGALVGRPLLIVTADHPLLTGSMVADFLRGAETGVCDVAVGMTPVGPLARRYPDVRCTSLPLRDGRYSGCNLYALVTPSGWRAVDFWAHLEAARKAPHRIAAQLGVVSLAGYLLRRWTLAEAFDRLSGRVGCRVAPVLLDQPEAAIDVDTPADLRFVRGLAAGGADDRSRQDTTAKAGDPKPRQR